MKIQEYLEIHSISFDRLKELYPDEYQTRLNSELNLKWLVPIEDKLDKLNDKDEITIREVINVLKSNESFTESHKTILSIFVSKINSIVKVADRINNFKEATKLQHNETLELYELFNHIKSSDSLLSFDFILNKNLQAFIPHLFSVIKNCQDPENYPVYYKFWKQISKEILHQNDDYDTLCKLFRTFPDEKRNTQFGSYFSVIAEKLIENIDNYQSLEKYSTAKYLKEKVINLESFNVDLDKYLNMSLEKSKNIIVDVKSEFIDWLIMNDGKGSHYYSKSFNSDIFKLRKEFDSYELKYFETFNKNLFKINIELVQKEISRISKTVKDTHSDFYNYLGSLGSGGKNAILGKRHYLKFLQEYFNKENFTKEYFNKQNMEITKSPLNQIFYGPPGTGKTYSTIAKAINIVDPNFDSKQCRKAVKDKYKKLVESGLIVFTTFHQSMSYEDFVEGIKPMIEEDTQGNKSVVYDVEDGIFKKIVNQAKKIEKVDRADIDWNNVDYYKMSLGGKSNPQEHSYCIHNNLGGISWGGANDLTELATINDWSTYKNKFLEKFPDVAEKSSFNIQASFTLFRMKEGDIVIATRGNHIIDAIGKVSGSYIFNDENPTSLSHFRKIDWFAKDLNSSPEKFLKKNISQQSIYQFYNEDIKLESFKELTATKDSSVKNYVLIIDEINRGNVSQIFGELITLIEDSKRLGKSEELQVTLPYSKDKFGVPSNLYIIGTMNTADRSIEALDTALRRRFCFEEMTSKENLLSPSAMYCRLLWKYEKVGWDDSEFLQKESNLFNLLGVSEQWHSEKIDIWEKMTKAEYRNLDNYFSKFSITGINLQSLLEKINERIEILLNRDHKIGHSYFIDVNSTDDLRTVFKNNIVPLLQEYFYGDYEKIGWILGEGFFVERKLDKNGVFTKFFKQPKPEFELEYQLADLDEIKIEIAVQKLLGTYKETTSTIEN